MKAILCGNKEQCVECLLHVKYHYAIGYVL